MWLTPSSPTALSTKSSVPTALEIAERRGDDAQGLYEAAWLTIVRPTGTPELNAQALERLEAACQAVAG